jgi:hypothetical protein
MGYVIFTAKLWTTPTEKALNFPPHGNFPHFIAISVSSLGEFSHEHEEKQIWRFKLPSGCLTLIVGTQKWGFSCEVQRRPPCGHLI